MPAPQQTSRWLSNVWQRIDAELPVILLTLLIVGAVVSFCFSFLEMAKR